MHHTLVDDLRLFIATQQADVELMTAYVSRQRRDGDPKRLIQIGKAVLAQAQQDLADLQAELATAEADDGV